MSGAKRAAEWLSTGAVVLLALCAATLTWSNVRRAFFPSATMLTEPADSVPNWADYAVGGNRVGPSQAPVTLIVFSDYQCPSCRQLFVKMEMIRRTYPEDVAVVWRHLPLEGHPFAVPAARASVCAAKAGRFEAMHSLLFLMPDSLGVVSWPSLALRAGIPDTIAFGACLGHSDTQARINNDLAAARAVHAVATPTLLVNELEYVGAPQDLTRIVRYVRRRRA
jgi:protein-disulfide isomerase